MRRYKRLRVKGGCYFFTVVLEQRWGNRFLIDNIDALRTAFLKVKRKHPFKMDAVVILPDHLHCIWQLPEDTDDYSTRWRLIKSEFSKSIEKGELVSKSRQRKGERGIWQRRFWEHLIRDDSDFQNHVDYIHYNPVKHGYVEQVKAWQYSSFHRWVEKGVYTENWRVSNAVRELDFEPRYE